VAVRDPLMAMHRDTVFIAVPPELERLYLDQPLAPGVYYRMSGRRRASRKRWKRYYHRQRLERLWILRRRSSPALGFDWPPKESPKPATK
jgi:hypothetical protein